MNTSRHSPPVDQLLTYGKVGSRDPKQWLDYRQELGFTEEHIPELIRLMTDTELWEAPSDDIAVWSTCHAWRALAQFQALEMFVPLLEMFHEYDEDDYLNEETPEVMALLGPEVLPIAQDYLERDDYSPWGKSSIAMGIVKIAEKFPDHQPTCIDIIRHRLESFHKNDDSSNGWLVEALVKFKVMDAVPLIERVYKEGDIDEMCAGTWPAVQVKLGLKQESDFSEEDFVPEFIQEMRATLPNLEAIQQFLNQPKMSAMESGLPIDVEAYRPEAPPKFGEGFLKAPKSAAPKPAPGFGQGAQSDSKSKKKKKKKK